MLAKPVCCARRTHRRPEAVPSASASRPPRHPLPDSGLLAKISGRLEFDEALNKAGTVANEAGLRFFPGKKDHKLQVYNSKGEIIVKSVKSSKSEAAIDAMHLYVGLIFKIILALILTALVWLGGTILYRILANAL